MALPTYFGSASNPVDGGSANEPVTLAITPPTSMVAGDLCILVGQIGVVTTGQISVSATGGQTWNVLGETGANAQCVATWWCEFTGSWSADPSLAFAAQSGTIPTTAVLHVFRPGDAAEQWVVDQAYAGAGYAAPGAVPWEVSRTGVTNTLVNTVTVVGWTAADDISWLNLWFPVDVSQYTGSVTTLAVQGGTAGSGETNQGSGQSFTTTSAYNLQSIAFQIGKVGLPTDNIFIEIATTINGTAIATSESINGAAIISLTLQVFNFPTKPALSNATQYFFRVLRSGVRDTSNYYRTYSSAADPYAGGTAYTLANTAWSQVATNDLFFAVNKAGENWLVPGSNSYRNLGGGDQSITFAYLIKEIPGATGNISQHQEDRVGPDAGLTFIASFASKMNLWAQSVL